MPSIYIPESNFHFKGFYNLATLSTGVLDLKILNIAGARPNFMKIAPIMDALRGPEGFESILVHTGQHYDDRMSNVFLQELGIPAPTVNLGVGSGERLEQIERIAARFEPVVDHERPDAVLVVGDVNSTVACARVASRKGIAVIHVEAGLRSFDRQMPEEINRIETDLLSDLLFVTEPSGMRNLARENVPGKAFHVGNVMIDTLVRHLDEARSREVAHGLGLDPGRFIAGTFHRPSNVDSLERLSSVVEIVESAAAHLPVVLPLHPRTRSSLKRFNLYDRLEENERVLLLQPLGYLDFVSLIDSAHAVITDSGGIQEETTFLRVPCITMRDNTERPVTVEVGSNILAGANADSVLSALRETFDRNGSSSSIPELWDGHTAERITSILQEELAHGYHHQVQSRAPFGPRDSVR